MGRTVGRRTHERRQRPGLRAGAGPASGSDAARVGRAARPRRRGRGRGRRALAPEPGGVKGFYVLLAAVALIGGGVIWYGSRGAPVATPAASAPLPVAASDGFKGFTLGADSARIEVTEYSDFECPFCASFATVQMPVIREQLIATGKVRRRYRDFPLLR